MYINEIPCKFIYMCIYKHIHVLLKSKPGYKTSISSNIHHFLETKASNIFSYFLSYAIHYDFYRHPVGNFVKLDCTIWSSCYFEECSPFSITKSTNSFPDPALTRSLLPPSPFPFLLSSIWTFLGLFLCLFPTSNLLASTWENLSALRASVFLYFLHGFSFCLSLEMWFTGRALA